MHLGLFPATMQLMFDKKNPTTNYPFVEINMKANLGIKLMHQEILTNKLYKYQNMVIIY